MKHPISGKAIYLYLLIWGLIIVIHALLLHQLYGFTLQWCLLDTAVFYLPLAGFGLSSFYIVKYFRSPKGLGFNNVIAHFIAVLAISLLVSYIWMSVMNTAFPQAEYQAYVSANLEWHVLSGTLLLMLVIMFYYIMDSVQRLRLRDTREKALEEMLRETEMEMLKFQINPHFIFNSLNSISALTIEQPRQAQEMIIRLSEFFRNALGKDRKALHSLEEELRQIDIYLEIERIRFGDRLQVRNEIGKDCLNHQVPALILQPLYENAIKYGLYDSLEPVLIQTRVTCTETGVKISVTNPYDSLSPLPRGRGIGLKNVRSRLELMYHIPDLVTIERTKNQFTIHLFIPHPVNDTGNNY